MNLGSSIKNLSFKFNLALRICRQVHKACEPKFSAAVPSIISKDINNFPQNLHLKQETNWLISYKCEEESFFSVISKTDLIVNKKIIEPEKTIKISIETPLRISTNNDLQLPCNIEKDMIEPTKNIISIKALNMYRIRARKMRKHQLRKFLKKMKFEFMKKKIRKRIQKEFVLQTQLKDILKESEIYCPERVVTETLEKVHWTKPVTRVKGRLAPQWVIKEYLEDKHERKVLKLRLKECSEKLK